MTLRPSKSRRRYSLRKPTRIDEGDEISSPVDQRVHLPESERQIERRTLSDGTVLTTYVDQPETADEIPEIEGVPEPQPKTAPQAPGESHETAPGEGTGDPWERLR